MEIRGIYSKTLWRDNKNGATFFLLSVPDTVKEAKNGNIVVFASIPNYQKGMPLYVEGEFEKTSKGIRLKAGLVREDTWDNVSAQCFLTNPGCGGISNAIACNLISKFGYEIFDLAEDPEMPTKMASKIRRFTEDDARVLCEKIKKTKKERELLEYLVPYGGFWATAGRLYSKYGAKSIETIKSNPFIGMKYGLTFEQCDRIAADTGHHALSENRILAAAKAQMEKFAKAGDTYSYMKGLLTAVEKLLNKAGYENNVPFSALSPIISKSDDLTFETGLYNKVFLNSLLAAEVNIAKQIKRLMESGRSLNFTKELITQAEESCGISYAPNQKEAFSLLKKNGVAIVTGGPGTGKTTTVNGIISAYRSMCPDAVVKLCAPTGRAAQRMAESTNEEAVTIHRLLDYRPYENEIVYKNAHNPIEADFIVIDEASMLDVELASILFSAIKDDTLVLLIGDIHQLPSVGAGDVLHDLIESKKVPCVHLTAVFRQAETSPIVVNANTINDGEKTLIENDDFMIRHMKDDTDIPKEVIRVMRQLYDPAKPFDTTILCPTHKSDAGVATLNKQLQELLNPNVGEKEYRYGNRTYRKGDKIIMLRNNYSVGYYNGDLGMVTEIMDEGIEVNIMDKVMNITRDMMEDINLAYAMTIHKSQGSEFKNVIISLPFRPVTMLKRNLIYTAVTRAKEKVVIIAENGALDKAISCTNTGVRQTSLIEKIREELTKYQAA